MLVYAMLPYTWYQDLTTFPLPVMWQNASAYSGSALTSGALAKMEAPTAEPEVELALFEQVHCCLDCPRAGDVFCTAVLENAIECPIIIGKHIIIITTWRDSMQWVLPSLTIWVYIFMTGKHTLPEVGVQLRLLGNFVSSLLCCQYFGFTVYVISIEIHCV